MFDNMSVISIAVLGSLAMFGWSGIGVACALSGNDFLVAIAWIMLAGLFLIYGEIRKAILKRARLPQKSNDVT